MLLSLLFFRTFRFLLPPCILAVVYLYLYPLFNGCAFAVPDLPPEPSTCILEPAAEQQQAAEPSPTPWIAQARNAQLRLLAFGDPQLEGDSSLPNPDDLAFPSLRKGWRGLGAGSFSGGLEGLRSGTLEFLKEDIPVLLNFYRKRLDLLGNDYYLAHIYRSLHWWTQPTHVTVLGDLLGSQWISDEEFERRSWRFWNRVFRRGERVDDSVTSGSDVEVLGYDSPWSRRIINIAGNHDIGYAGDLDTHRVARFDRAFGKVNWDITFELPLTSISNANAATTTSSPTLVESSPSLRLVVLNSMNLDTPALTPSVQQETYDFLNRIIRTSRPIEDRTAAIILLTHIPLHKEVGVCVDAPFFDFFSPGEGGGVKEQNHISYDVSKNAILQGIFGMSGNKLAPAQGHGRNGIILTGHDHEGCDVYHHVPVDAERNGSEWRAERWLQAKHKSLVRDEDVPGIREVTVRSMMGEYGGNAALVSAWFDPKEREWKFEVRMCALGVQHIWWAVHVFVLVEMLLIVAAVVAYGMEMRAEIRAKHKRQPDGKWTRPDNSGPGSEDSKLSGGSLGDRKEVEAKVSYSGKGRAG